MEEAPDQVKEVAERGEQGNPCLDSSKDFGLFGQAFLGVNEGGGSSGSGLNYILKTLLQGG